MQLCVKYDPEELLLVLLIDKLTRLDMKIVFKVTLHLKKQNKSKYFSQ